MAITYLETKRMSSDVLQYGVLQRLCTREKVIHKCHKLQSSIFMIHKPIESRLAVAKTGKVGYRRVST